MLFFFLFLGYRLFVEVNRLILTSSESPMAPDETKAALRNLINATIKGDPDNQAAAIVHDVLQAKMQKRIAGKVEGEAEAAPASTNDEEA